MSWTLSTSAQALTKAGENADATITGDAAALAFLSDQAEADLFLQTGYDWVANYANVRTNAKPVLSKAIACAVAIEIINYNMRNYTSRAEAQTMLNVLTDEYNRILNTLKDFEFRDRLLTVVP